MCTIHLWYSVFGNAAAIASFIPVKPSAHITSMSFTPRFLRSLNRDNYVFALSFVPIYIDNMSFLSSWFTPNVIWTAFLPTIPFSFTLKCTASI